MITRNHHLVPELKAIEVLKEFDEIFVAAISGEVSCVNEYISVHLCDLVKLAVAPVGIRYNDNIKLFSRQLLHVYYLNVYSN